ncbi:adenosine deaminase [Candidatus Vecturithrix granuli]|uniref:Adenosine deaminase n=1 Tax=Vecturithrix granuli TaxID=1499967 RepID=A0A081C201_VECG1|nr:adenosine deaminase [Candidatus Vecturithrix granuli]
MQLSKTILQQLPKSELHVHLRGAVSVEILAELMRTYPKEKIWHGIPAWRRRIFMQSPNLRRFLALNTVTAEHLRNLFDE